MKWKMKRINALVGMLSVALLAGHCRDMSGILKDEVAPVLDSSSVSGTSSASDQITLTWQTASDNKASASEINYELCIAQTANGCSNFVINFTTSPGATQYTFSGLAEATFYYIRIRPRDNAGNVGTASTDIQVRTALVPAGAPVFGVAPGSYNASQNVSLTSSTAGAIICYTVDLATPACNATPVCTTGTQIANGNTVSVGSNLTLKAIACKLNKLDTAVISGNYVIDSTPPTVPGSPTATPISTSQIDLSWTASTDAQTAQANIVYEICQTTTSTACNGGGFTATYTTAPGVTAYSVNSGLATLTTYYFVIRAKDSLANVNPTAQISATTLAAGTVSTPTFSPVAGTYGSTQNATPSTSTGGAIVCYKTGSAPGACTAGPTCAVGSTQFSSAVAIASTSTLYAVGCKTGYTESTTGSALYTIDNAAPTTPGSFTATAASSSQINLAWTASSDDTTATGSIVYEICKTTTSGGCGTFSATFTTAGGATSYNDTGLNPLTNYYYVIRARDSFSKFGTPSSEQTGTTQSLGTVNAPTFSPVAGTYGVTQNVTQSTSTSGAIICYKMGSAPGACTAGPTCAAGATQFSSAVSVASTGTMYAVGCKTSYTDSSVASAVFTIDTVAPSTGTAISLRSITDTTLTVNWGVATDAVTIQASLEYKVVKDNASATNIDTIAEVDAKTGGDLLQDWAANITTKALTSLSSSTAYHFAVLVRDSIGNKSLYAPASQMTLATGGALFDAGATHTCALKNGVVTCWGGNANGQSTVPALTAPTSVITGDNHTCAIDSTGAHCWGNNTYGQITMPSLTGPVEISGGFRNTCAIDATGVKCWGYNGNNQNVIPGLTNPNRLSTGSSYICVIASTGLVCWGWNGQGQLNLPVLTNPTKYTTGRGEHICAIDNTGVHCWGANGNGQSNVPALTNPTAITAGALHSCAIDNTGVHCWGDNTYGQLSVPVLSNPTVIKAGSYHTCASDDTGLHCWGRNTNGQCNVP